MSIQVVLTLIVSFGAASAAAPALVGALRGAGVLDHPSERSSHDQPTVRGAGLLCAVGVLAGCVVGALLDPTVSWVFILIAGVGAAATTLGFLEDLMGVSIAIRAGAQLLVGAAAAAVLCVAAGVPIWIGVAGTIAIVVYMNIANFMDGVDAMSVGHAAVVGSTWVVLSVLDASPVWGAEAGGILLGAFLAFLPWNLRTPKAFLGDAGSYLLGALISTTTAAAIVYGVEPIGVVAPLAIYLADTGYTLARRAVTGKRWYESHREHVYHRLEDLGDSHLVVTGTVMVLSILCAILGVLSVVELVPSLVAWVGIVAIMGCYVALPAVRSRVRRVRARAGR